MHRPTITLITAAILILASAGLAFAQSDPGSAMPSASSAAEQGTPSGSSAGSAMPSAKSAGSAMPSGGTAQQPAAAGNGQTAAGKPEGRVAHAAITTDIQQRKPQNHLTTVPNSVRKVYYFTDVRGLQGKTITHRWLYQGKTMAAVKFDIGGNRWRTWSSKTMLAGWTGKWTCETVGPNGNVLNTTTFRYTRGGSLPGGNASSGGASATSGASAGGSGTTTPSGSGSGGNMSSPSAPQSGGSMSMPQNGSASHMPMQQGTPATSSPSPSE
ncbi:MAG TPA: DUF2914 domain-containing protein [Gammaproteobacteria bacterium]|nr:DUF2914 domain-containing protein [Gammaproteobacteria bacterium]